VNTGRAFKAALLLGAAISLSGCVAAAIPLVAGGALARSATDGRDADTAPVAAPAPADEAAPAMPSGEVRVAATPDAETPAPVPVPPPARTPVTTASVARDPASPNSARAAAFTPLLEYVNRMRTDSMESAYSAMLADRLALSALRKPCTQSEKAIVIDLDPGEGLFDPLAVTMPSPLEINSLANMRKAGIRIVWISNNRAPTEDAIRAALGKAGLDPAGKDTLLLLRKPDDRKQTLREALSENTCLIAIAGDRRGDFDELFDFLKDPDSARDLDMMIGNGWFLLPAFADTNTATEPKDQPAS
jgi:hypothetical protein